MRVFKLKRSERGDTIVEVLIAIAVVTSVLSITYATMNRNLVTMRNNQERTEASKLAQAQLEALKGLYSANPGAITANATAGFCINGTTIVAVASKPQGTLEDDDLAYGACESGFYRYVLKRDAVIASQYTATVRWEAFGSGRSEVVMVYRVQ